MKRGEPKPEPSAFIYALKTLYATNIWLSSVQEKMEWNCFILTFLFSVCYKFENMLKVYTVNSHVSHHPWCTTRWLLTGGGHLWDQSRKGTDIELINEISMCNQMVTSEIGE